MDSSNDQYAVADGVTDNDAPEPVRARAAIAPAFAEVLDKRYARRDVLMGGTGLAVTSFLVGGEAEAKGPAERGGGRRQRETPAFNFEPVVVNRDDMVTVPAGYTAQAFIPWGTPLTGSYPAYQDGGLNTGAEQEQQVGQHHDGMHYFPMFNGARGNERGLLCVNHEYVQQNTLHADPSAYASPRTVEDAVRKEIAAHGVSVVDVRKSRRSGEWEVVRSYFNRRITGATPMAITGPVSGSKWVQTKFSPRGTRARGTLNNCGHGYTPWGTYLTCEENWAGYFVNRSGTLPREQSAYGVATSASRYRGEDIPGDAYERFDVTPKGATALDDYRNEVNGHGWIVEIDPWRSNSLPKKRTALARFAHEGAWTAPVRVGEPVVIYMGDDSQFEYIYKFVTKKKWNPVRTDGDVLDEGTLYVAKFREDGSGEWLPLDFDKRSFQRAMADWAALDPVNNIPFEDQAELLINTRLAAEVYFTLTNNSNRTPATVDAANPRGPNPTDHIIRFAEGRGNIGGGRRNLFNFDALEFEWDIFVFGGPPIVDGLQNPSELDETNAFASPDGLWVDDLRIVWIQTDMSGSQLNAGPFGNNQMLVANPDTGEIKRIFTGVPGCEVTGVISTPDYRTMFVNLQHPGEQGFVPPGALFSSAYPDGDALAGALNFPRSTAVIVTKDDGGIVGT